MKFDATAAREFSNGLGYLDGAGPEIRLWLHSAIDAVDAAQQEAYAEGRKDEREDVVQQCIDIVAMHGGSVEIEAAMRRLIDDEAPQCGNCYGKGWNDERKAVNGHYQGAEVFRIDCDHCGGSGLAG